jgi:hypothetical protein
MEGGAEMKLTELEPRWIHPNVFVFLCPHCRGVLLSCKNIQMLFKEQRLLFEREFGDDWANQVVPMDPEYCWSISGTIPDDPRAAFAANLSVTPSIDASASGHWHGHVTNGEITP